MLLSFLIFGEAIKIFAYTNITKEWNVKKSEESASYRENVPNHTSVS